MRSKGEHYETLAENYLSKRGLALVERNFSCQLGEIDLIMRDGNTLVFVEVKYRSNNDYGLAEETVTLNKQRKILHTAQLYLESKTLWHMNTRFDVVAFSGKRHMFSTPKTNWIKAAFCSH